MIRAVFGANVALFNGMMNVIISESLQDQKYIDARTEGYEELVEVVKDYTPEVVAGICGIHAEDLKKGARMYAQADKAGIYYAMGVTQHSTGTPILHVGMFSRGERALAPYRPSAETPDADYPMIFTTGRILYHYHTSTMTGRVEGLRRPDRKGIKRHISKPWNFPSKPPHPRPCRGFSFTQGILCHTYGKMKLNLLTKLTNRVHEIW